MPRGTRSAKIGQLKISTNHTTEPQLRTHFSVDFHLHVCQCNNVHLATKFKYYFLARKHSTLSNLSLAVSWQVYIVPGLYQPSGRQISLRYRSLAWHLPTRSCSGYGTERLE